MKATFSDELAAPLKQIESHAFDVPDASQRFENRLAVENGWTSDFTRRAIAEYRRFAFLFAATGQPVAPSEIIDRVWHLHLLYTRNYWDVFCKEVMKRPLHHEPATGGTGEQDRLADWYASTIDRYRAFFGEPPTDIWPNPRTLANTPRPKHRWIDVGNDLVISRKTAHRLVAAVGFIAVALIGVLAWAASK